MNYCCYESSILNHMQGIMKNNKNKKIRGAFAVCMHTEKDILVTLPCAYTQQSGHVTQGCAPGSAMGVLGGPLPCVLEGGRTAKPSTTAEDYWTVARGTHDSIYPHRKVLGRKAAQCKHCSKSSARQRFCRAA
jgi:hypothetical protein